MVMFSNSKKNISKYCIIWLSRKNSYKKYATLVIAYLKRSFEEKSFHFFYWSDIIIQDYHYNIF